MYHLLQRYRWQKPLQRTMFSHQSHRVLRRHLFAGIRMRVFHRRCNRLRSFRLFSHPTLQCHCRRYRARRLHLFLVAFDDLHLTLVRLLPDGILHLSTLLPKKQCLFGQIRHSSIPMNLSGNYLTEQQQPTSMIFLSTIHSRVVLIFP
jgi:hypothetical protein